MITEININVVRIRCKFSSVSVEVKRQTSVESGSGFLECQLKQTSHTSSCDGEESCLKVDSIAFPGGVCAGLCSDEESMSDTFRIVSLLYKQSVKEQRVTEN